MQTGSLNLPVSDKLKKVLFFNGYSITEQHCCITQLYGNNANRPLHGISMQTHFHISNSLLSLPPSIQQK